MTLSRTLCALLMLLCMPAALHAQSPGRSAYSLQSLRDLDETSFEYCRLLGASRAPDSPAFAAVGTIETSGSSTTVTEEVSGTLPFENVSVGDELEIRSSEHVVVAAAVVTRVGEIFRRVVTAKASGASITVHTALNITKATFTYRKLECGTAATNGWVPTGGSSSVSFSIHVDQINTTSGVTVQAECENIGSSSSPIPLWSKVYTTATDDLVEFIGVQCDRMRVGSKLTSTDDGSDTGAAAEQISLYVRGRMEQ